MKPHKHAELIKAWADGAIIEYQCIDDRDDWEEDEIPCWNDERFEFRIKPGTNKLSDHEILRVSKQFNGIPVSTKQSWNKVIIDLARALEVKIFEKNYFTKTKDIICSDYFYYDLDDKQWVGTNLNAPNLKLIFDSETGKLKDAEVLE